MKGFGKYFIFKILTVFLSMLLLFNSITYCSEDTTSLSLRTKLFFSEREPKTRFLNTAKDFLKDKIKELSIAGLIVPAIILATLVFLNYQRSGYDKDRKSVV